MANKRMFNKTVIDSDAFLDMPQTTQNLYFHLNMRADDDGFVDSPKKVMRSIGSNQNDLELLLAKRYLLAFDSGVIVIKHWKLHNTIRKDRYKPTLYLEEMKTLIEKGNGIYTESYKALEQQELEQWQPHGNQMTTNGKHRLGLDKIRLDIDKTNKKKINKKEMPEYSHYSGEPEKPKDNISNRIQESIDHWNSKSNLPHCAYTVLNIGSDLMDIKTKFDVFRGNEINEAIDNLSTYWNKIPDEYKTKSFQKFIIRSLDNWLESANPGNTFNKSKSEGLTPEQIKETEDLPWI